MKRKFKNKIDGKIWTMIEYGNDVCVMLTNDGVYVSLDTFSLMAYYSEVR